MQMNAFPQHTPQNLALLLIRTIKGSVLMARYDVMEDSFLMESPHVKGATINKESVIEWRYATAPEHLNGKSH